ncbi:serine/threonine protein kinase [Pyxidicoccus parkwayensis]|uniref:Serine/threonine protein kinase n=1 Tax=Pyxidicoccus parkwayensis TaxID=2813578 RepID=A0ABX7P3P0_9BACT|nr:serine/threonine-protein kinase [Pyxidicoccus parkwaysis]QSQ25094.1 serine/threonine protein kinase [Pyxidicoccus parkwaysis]
MALFICQRCEAEHDAWTGACPACGGTELLKVGPQVDRMVGRTIAGRYRIIRRLGQGGMGSVYLAEQVGIGQQVAMKFLNTGLSMDPDVARRFLNEAKSYARVAHPNAINLHDFGQDEEGTLYICMEYVEGDDLKRLLSNVGRLAVHEAADIVLQVADVLAYAHARQVVHRDLKPENVMVRQGMRGWHVKVLDFGIARISDGAPRLTLQGAVAGTPRYMSPEQAMGQDVDSRADIYAVGVVLFELLTGKQPFDGTSVAEIMQKQVHQPMPHLWDVVEDLQLPAIDAVIQKATAKKRVERYATMEAFASDLSNALPTLTGRSPISGVNPTVKGASRSNEEQGPGTLLYGDGSEATLVRGPTPPVGAVRHDTARMTPIPRTQPAMTPIPLTQPAMTQAPRMGLAVSDGFDKTAHTASPYTEQKRSRTGLVMGLGAAVVLVAAGVGVVAIRNAGGDSTQPVPAPTAPVAPARVEAPTPAPSPAHVEAPTPAPAPPGEEAPTPAPTASPSANTGRSDEETPPAPSGADALLAKQLKLLAAGQAIEIGNDFNEGRLDSAMKRLALAREQGLEAAAPELATLGARIEDASKRMSQARSRENDGDCEHAIKLYKALKKDYPQLIDAAKGIARCKDSLPPEVSE